MSRGRPREFDPDAALEHALNVFNRDGFESASVQTLADSMGICKPSLYAAYGNKEGLFIAAVERYARLTAERRTELLDSEPDGRRAVAAMLMDVVATYTRCREHSGCVVVAEAAGGSIAAHSDAIRDALATAMASSQATLRCRLARARDEGEIPRETDVDALARYFGTVMAGLSVHARNGASAEELAAVVQTTMCAWPSAGPARMRAVAH